MLDLATDGFFDILISAEIWNNIFLPWRFSIYDSLIFSKRLIKVVQIIKCTCTVFIANVRNVSTNSLM